MNRVIRFRGWDEQHKCWRHGWLARLTEGARRFMSIICDDDEGVLTRYYIHQESSIGQFTGLKDRNGAEIFEGDIIEYSHGRYAVTWLKNRASLGICGEPLPAGCADDCEVVGNIYENSELLEI